MSLDTMDFQPVVHQYITQLMDGWKAAGFDETEVQENASQMFNMGLIAGQQIQQEKVIKLPEGNPDVPYTPEMADRTIRVFLKGMDAALYKAHENHLPSQEKWQLLQNVAYHVFEQCKQVALATLGQEETPEIQIPDEQIVEWLSQTAIEALLYYLAEHEKQHGPISRVDDPMLSPEALAPIETETPLEDLPVAPAVAPKPVSAVSQLPDIHHKYAAVALLLNGLLPEKQSRILAAFQPEERETIAQYKDPEVVAQQLDLARVAQYLKAFKEKMGQSKAQPKSKHAAVLSQMVQQLPAQRLERLFASERSLVRGYVTQWAQGQSHQNAPYTLPSGVEESLALYLKRNFSEELASV